MEVELMDGKAVVVVVPPDLKAMAVNLLIMRKVPLEAGILIRGKAVQVLPQEIRKEGMANLMEVVELAL